MNHNASQVLRLADEAGVDMFSNRYLSDQQGAMGELQDRYYPDSATFAVPSGERPVASYRVVCTTPAELALAHALRPNGVSAEILLEQK
jgi:hypothetical protein